MTPDTTLELTLWRTLRRHVLLMSALAFLGALLAYGLTRILTPEWEAVGRLRIGQITGEMLDTPRNLVERMELAAFRTAISQSLKLEPPPDSKRAELFRGSLRAKLLPNTDLVELRVRGTSRAEAAEWLEAVIARIRSEHEQKAAPMLARLKQFARETETQLRSAEAQYARLMEQSTWLKQRFGAGRKQSEDLVLYILATKLTDRIDKLTLLRNELEDQLSPLKTFPTALIEPIYTPLHRAFPRTQVFVWFSGLIGLVLGLLVVYMLTWRELRLQPPHA